MEIVYTSFACMSYALHELTVHKTIGSSRLRKVCCRCGTVQSLVLTQTNCSTLPKNCQSLWRQKVL